MTEKNIEVLYKGDRVYYEEVVDGSGVTVRILKRMSYSVHLRYVVSIEQSYNVFTEEKKTCLLTLVSGEKLHVVGAWKELTHLHENYIKNTEGL